MPGCCEFITHLFRKNRDKEKVVHYNGGAKPRYS